MTMATPATAVSVPMAKLEVIRVPFMKRMLKSIVKMGDALTMKLTLLTLVMEMATFSLTK